MTSIFQTSFNFEFDQEVLAIEEDRVIAASTPVFSKPVSLNYRGPKISAGLTRDTWEFMNDVSYEDLSDYSHFARAH